MLTFGNFWNIVLLLLIFNAANGEDGAEKCSVNELRNFNTCMGEIYSWNDWWQSILDGRSKLQLATDFDPAIQQCVRPSVNSFRIKLSSALNN